MTNPNLLNVVPKDLNKPKSIENFDTSISYELPIFTGFKLYHARQMAALQVKANEIKFQRDEKLLAKETLSAYNGAVAAKYFIEAAKKGKETTSSFVKLAGDFLDAGMVVKSDKLQAESYDAQVNAKLIEANNAYQLALAYLRFLSSDETITDVGAFENVTVLTKESLETLKQDALLNREDFKWMDYNVKTMHNKVGFESADQWPMIGLQAKYGFSDDRITTNNEKSYYLVGVGLSYTLFDGGKTRADAQKAKVEYLQTKNYYEYMRDGIALDVEKNFLTYQAKKAVIIEKQKSKEFSEEVVEHTTEMYKNGLTPMANLLLKEADAAKARAELIQAKYDEAMAAAELRLALGMKFVEKDGE
jgi:outer membrane protein TolC